MLPYTAASGKATVRIMSSQNRKSLYVSSQSPAVVSRSISRPGYTKPIGGHKISNNIVKEVGVAGKKHRKNKSRKRITLLDTIEDSQ